MAQVRQIHQSQVPDGMAGNVPWGTPFEQWTDRMIERGIDHLRSDLSQGVDSPRLRAALGNIASERGLDID